MEPVTFVGCVVATALAGVFIGQASAAITKPQPLTPPIIPGCFYTLPDGRRVQVTKVSGRFVTYGVIEDGHHIIWDLDREVFASNATLIVPPKPAPAPEGSLSEAERPVGGA